MWIPKCALLDLCVNSLACRQCRVCLSCTPPQYGRQSHTDKVKKENFPLKLPIHRFVLDISRTCYTELLLLCEGIESQYEIFPDIQ